MVTESTGWLSGALIQIPFIHQIPQKQLTAFLLAPWYMRRWQSLGPSLWNTQSNNTNKITFIELCVCSSLIREAEPLWVIWNRHLLWELEFPPSWEQMKKPMEVCGFCIWWWTEVIVGEQGWQPGRKTEHGMGEGGQIRTYILSLTTSSQDFVGDLQKKLGVFHHRAACPPGPGLTEAQDLGSWECCGPAHCPMPARGASRVITT